MLYRLSHSAQSSNWRYTDQSALALKKHFRIIEQHFGKFTGFPQLLTLTRLAEWSKCMRTLLQHSSARAGKIHCGNAGLNPQSRGVGLNRTDEVAGSPLGLSS